MANKENGWVIERYIGNKLHYWNGGKPNSSDQGFTENHDRAVRLCREEDAMVVLFHLLDGMGRVAEHNWHQAIVADASGRGLGDDADLAAPAHMPQPAEQEVRPYVHVSEETDEERLQRRMNGEVEKLRDLRIRLGGYKPGQPVPGIMLSEEQCGVIARGFDNADRDLAASRTALVRREAAAIAAYWSHILNWTPLPAPPSPIPERE